MAEQKNFKRAEIKYMTDTYQAMRLIDKCRDRMIADEHGKSTVYSLYMDTPDYLLARRSLERPIYKEKLRLRSYGMATDDSQVFIELKKKFDSIVYKRRVQMDLKSMEMYLNCKKIFRDSDRSKEYKEDLNLKLIQELAAKNNFSDIDIQIMKELDFAIERYENIQPKVLLTYDRESYYAADDHELRITFDTNVKYRTDELTLRADDIGTRITADDQVLMEIKAGGAIPIWFTNILTEEGLFPQSFSKYGTAYSKIVTDAYKNGYARRYAYAGAAQQV